MAKPEALPYQPGKRAMLKIKHARTADCVVAGFRWYKGGKGTLVGSLLLGLYDDEGVLHHVGIASAFKQAERAELAEQLEPLREGAREDHPWREWAEWQEQETAQRLPGATSRWNRGKDLSWEPLRIELVVRGRRSITCRARGFATRRTSSAGGPTSRRASAATISSRRPPRTSSRRSSAREPASATRTRVPRHGGRAGEISLLSTAARSLARVRIDGATVDSLSRPAARAAPIPPGGGNKRLTSSSACCASPRRQRVQPRRDLGLDGQDHLRIAMAERIDDVARRARRGHRGQRQAVADREPGVRRLRRLPLNRALRALPVRIRRGTTVVTHTPCFLSSTRMPSDSPTSANLLAV